MYLYKVTIKLAFSIGNIPQILSTIEKTNLIRMNVDSTIWTNFLSFFFSLSSSIFYETTAMPPTNSWLYYNLFTIEIFQYNGRVETGENGFIVCCCHIESSICTSERRNYLWATSPMYRNTKYCYYCYWLWLSSGGSYGKDPN